jgi:hypothetical protein
METWGQVHECGTVACAIGWATLDPRMNELGLVLQAELGDEQEIITDVEGMLFAAREYGGDVEFVPYLKGTNNCGFSAVAEFFDLPLAIADDLFSAGGYDTGRPLRPVDVISRIKDLLTSSHQL